MTPYWEDDRVQLYLGDCLDVMRRMPDASVDAVVCDPPYALTELSTALVLEAIAAWMAGDRDYIPDGPSGFMGRRWDRFVPPPGAWDECMRVLKPGGHLLAFAGARTVDLMGLSIRIAGFQIRDSIDWIFGAGFPKSLDVGKAIDKAAGAEREVVGTRTYAGGHVQRSSADKLAPPIGTFARSQDARQETAPATEDAARWDGWGTALKPAHEPVVCAQKPFNAVPFDWRLVAHVHHALAGLLWLSLSPAKRAETSSRSRSRALDEARCVSALVSAALDTSPDASEATATYSSPALASTCSNIAGSWNSTLAALSGLTNTSTTSTASSTTTALRTLSSLLAPLTSPTTMPNCECLRGGGSSPARSAAASSNDAWQSWIDTLSRSVPATAIEGIGLAVSGALVSVAGELSNGPAEVSTAPWDARTAHQTTPDGSPSDNASGAGGRTNPAETPGSTARVSARGAQELSRQSPTHEPIVVARKPFAGTVAQTVLEHGTGALNIAACRVPAPGGLASGGSPRGHRSSLPMNADKGAAEERERSPEHPAGRWPTNTVFSHLPECGPDDSTPCQPGCPVAELDRQSGMRRAGSAVRGDEPSTPFSGTYGVKREKSACAGRTDEGGASRFFPTFRYEAKAPASERPRLPDGTAHATVKPLALMRWLVRLVTPPGGTVLDPFAGSGTTGEAAVIEGFRAVLIEREAPHAELIKARLGKPIAPVLDIEELM